MPSDESGDAHQFAQQLAQRCAEAGVKFSYETCIVGLFHSSATATATAKPNSTPLPSRSSPTA
jgi:glycine/D-amino acid oxidase-like deaminating enzyme